MSKEDDFTRVFIMVFGFLVVFTIVVVLIARSLGLDEYSGPMTDKDIDARTMPYGSVKVAGEPDSAEMTPAEAPAAMAATEAAPAPEASSSSPAPAPEAAAPAVTEKVAEATPAIDGKALYVACMGCHNTGVANAPKLGDKAAWAPRIAKGMDSMMKIALGGKGAMPPKGGRMDYSDDQVRAVVQYMVKEAQ